MRKAIVGSGLLLGLVGCATAQPVPTEQLVDSEVSIRQAEQAGAEKVPDAARHLQWARQQTQEARKLLEKNKGDQAALYLNRAEADAELALALAHEAPTRAEAERVRQQVQQLRQQSQQQNPQQNPVQ